MKILHISDVHVQVPDWRRRGPRSLGVLGSIATAKLWLGRGGGFDDAADKLRAWAKLGERYDHVLCTGDLTQLGVEEEFALARAALEPLASDPSRFTVLPGNHDRYPWSFRAQRFFEKHFPEQSAPVRRLDGVTLVLADTSGALSWPNLSPGAFSANQAQELRTTLAGIDGVKLVVVHHAPLRSTRRTVILGAQRLLDASRGAAAIVGGHVHERYTVNGPPLVVCCGSSTETGNEGAWELEVRDGTVRVSLVAPPF